MLETNAELQSNELFYSLAILAPSFYINCTKYIWNQRQKVLLKSLGI